MAETLTTVTTLIRDNLDESVAGYWSDTEIQRKIIRRFRELWSRIIPIRADWFKSATPYTLNIVAGTMQYSMPSDFFRVCAIRTTTSGKADIKWVWMSAKDPRFIDMQRTDGNISDPATIYYDTEGVTSLVISPYPVSALTAAVEYYTLPTDPATTFSLPDPMLRYIEAGATADCLAKGPVGLITYWQNETIMAWNILLPLLGAPRSGQNNGVVISPFEVP
jgi:hypothetical protein